MVLAWIRLLGLPGYLYKKKIIEEIGGTTGKVVRLDFNTDSRIKGRFARMAIFINLDKPLIAQVLVNSRHQRVKYEALPTISFSYGVVDLDVEQDKRNEGKLADFQGKIKVGDNEGLQKTKVWGSSNSNKFMQLGRITRDPLLWLILGYFNAILSAKEKKSDRTIDRTLANDAWISAFPHTLVFHLPRIKSDHRPILLKTNPKLKAPRGRSFQFIFGWTKQANFKDLIGKKWSFLGNMAITLFEFTLHVKEWNKSVYGFIGTRKRKNLRSFEDIQKAIEYSSFRRLVNLEMEIRDELESVLNHEELLWRQKARCDWLQFGDRNAKFFHSCTLQKRKFNRILALRLSNEEWCSDQSMLNDEAVRFFESLYGEIPTPMSELPSNLFPRLEEKDIGFLKKPILND
ncbi:hypothetical protein J1N35_041385 [Gossypium stocksii]|uniref:DUF4283 domain-containing protein n=1 Tax=Gossypium stocksii TaxID=47602 RepID=A0A9D3ZJ82_9ROSI|nr:hypothetical protein J1N35_041385 [Gossypium stocksii]